MSKRRVSESLRGQLMAAGCVVLCLTLSACSAAAYRSEPGAPVLGKAVPRGAVVVYVSNDHAEDVRVSVVRGSTLIPIGSVGSYSARRFVIPPAQVGLNGELQLMAQALASQAIAAPEALDLQPGAEVEFHIENNLLYSRLVPRVYRRQ